MRISDYINGFEDLITNTQEYFEYIDSFTRSGDRITYSDSDAQISL